ncbi:uncharacterized protein KY384_001400 [Bacidia gigantensis]|uniref:uncharacterized protein n=1 Tax=Bacidia gigantensis TaxID=2732470 RepID=UPI001D0524BC|nr:uncharacterized protein KY384_001400 [Bacidia gigantensis]KAG8533659.1 hypothetical protein KY384_001400 [Bacidia gigantensis]
MRLIKQSIDPRTTAGSITLYPEDPEDMWFTYNLLRPGDLLRASALRRVTTESTTGSTSSQRVHMTLLIRVTALDFDMQASQLHVSGRIAEETKHTKVGQFHTLDLELNRNFTVEKKEGWDSVARALVSEACDPVKSAEVWVVVMQEGLANIALLTGQRTVHRQKVEVGVPKKRGVGRQGDHDKGLERFYAVTMETLLRQIGDLGPEGGQVKPVLLASPGFTAQGFLKYVMETAQRKGDKALLARRDSFVVAHSASGYMHALDEVLKSPEVLARLKDTKYARETKVMDEFKTLLRKDDGRAWYGPREVEQAVEKGAVGRGGGVLLIIDDLFRAQDVAKRKRWVGLVDRVRDDEGGEVRILSGTHDSGKQLEALGGIAAILTFPLEDLDDDAEDEGEQSLSNDQSIPQMP